jgi:hypothetical protein
MLRPLGTVAAVLAATAALATPASALTLPDGRGWEMVSPIEKNGGEIQLPTTIFGGGVLQAAADGNSITYSSKASFADLRAASSASQYLSRRTDAGWSIENVTTPAAAGAFGDAPDGVPYQLFSESLDRGLIAAPQRCGSAPCGLGYDLRTSAGGALAASVEEPDLRFAGATSDLDQIVLSTCAALTPEAIQVPAAPAACDPAQTNLYEWSGGGLHLVNILPGDAAGTPGAALASQSGAISADGSRIYFDEAGNLYLREDGLTVQVDAAPEVGGSGIFQTAVADGSVAFFTKADHLYRYDAVRGTTTDLTPHGEVLGVLGASEDGSYLYYLTATGLVLAHAGHVIPVAAAADPTNYPPATGTARIAADGTLAFVSSAPLKVGFDNAGYPEVYVYSADTATLACASCDPRGARPIGAAGIPGAVANGSGAMATDVYKPRALSATGNRLFFDTVDALVAEDTNSGPDVYEWDADGVGGCPRLVGCVALISSGRSVEGATFVDAGADGSDVFFITDGSLVPSDPGTDDLYDARIGGGFPVSEGPLACIGDACQPIPAPPEDPTPGTAHYGPEGNPPAKFVKAKKHHKKQHHKKKPRHHRPKKHRAHQKRSHHGQRAGGGHR